MYIKLRINKSLQKSPTFSEYTTSEDTESTRNSSARKFNDAAHTMLNNEPKQKKKVTNSIWNKIKKEHSIYWNRIRNNFSQESNNTLNKKCYGMQSDIEKSCLIACNMHLVS